MALDRPVIGLEPSLPKPLNLWTPTKGKAMTTWLPDDEFDVLARKNGIDPAVKDGFAVPKQWFTRWPQIVMRARCLNVFPHEVRHIEQGNFHD